ncbi:MAG: hypothetical protein ACU4EQ_04025 [Candidatus Nitrosoglobus sp.]|jgi:zinc transporter ZupT
MLWIQGIFIGLQGIFIGLFILVHLFAGELRFLDIIPRSRWLSMAGGISVAYVFVHVLPELEEAQQRIGKQWQEFPAAEHHVYIMALVGLAVFYGLERVVSASQQRQAESRRGKKGETTSVGIFWLHISSFALYNGLIGYLLSHREEQDLRGLIFFSTAMALHFIVTDHGLRQAHRDTYEQLGRWVLGTAIIIGWGIGLATEVSGAAIDMLFAFLAGGVILNVLKEELPEERQSRLWPFVIGAAVYTILLLLF